MLEIKNGKKILVTPVTAEDLKDIKIGDETSLIAEWWKRGGRYRWT